MPCSCFGKKDKKSGGGPLLGGPEERYRPRDSRERDQAVPPSKLSLPTQSQTQPLLGASPKASPGTPPTTPLGTPTPGGAATRRRDVVASFYSDQCELIDFKTTGSRPPSTHVGASSPDGGPAATSSPATSSPSSTRSGGAFCRADLAEKRREFFRELNADDDDSTSRGSRPTSRLTDPGSQQTPRHSQYQEHQHHTLPHLRTSPRSNKLYSTPIVLQSPFHKNEANLSHDENQPLLRHSSPKQNQQEPKTSSLPKKKSEYSVQEIPKHRSHNKSDPASDSLLSDEDSDDVTLLSHTQTTTTTTTIPNTHVIVGSSVSTQNEQISSPVVFDLVNEKSSVNSNQVVDFTDIKDSDLKINVSPVEVNVKKNVELNINNPPVDVNESAKLVVDVPTIESNTVIFDNNFVSDKPNYDDKQQSPIITDSSFIVNSQELNVNMLSNDVHQNPFDSHQNPYDSHQDPSFDSHQNPFDSHQDPSFDSHQNPFDSHLMTDPAKDLSVILESEPNSTFTIESHPVENGQSNNEPLHLEYSLGRESFPQTHPVIINETLKESHKEQPQNTITFEGTPQNTDMFSFGLSHPDLEEEAPKTIVETTRQFISVSPDEQKTSETIVETTRQFITGPLDGQTDQQTVITTTKQVVSGSFDDLQQDAPQTIVETTRQFISGIPEEEEEGNQELLEAAKQFMSGSPDGQTIVKTTQQFVSGHPEEQFTQSIVETTQQFISDDPEHQGKQVTVKTTQQTFNPTSVDSFNPTSVDSFFLTSVEEPDELPEKLLFQTATTTTTTVKHRSVECDDDGDDSSIPLPESQLFVLEEEEQEKPKLPDVPCFGAPPPPTTPPPPLPEGQVIEDPFAAPLGVVCPPGGEHQLLPPAPPTPPAEQHMQTAPPLEDQQHHVEANDVSDLPPAPPTPTLDDVQLLPSSSPPPTFNEQLPPTPPTPLREDELPPAPAKMEPMTSPTTPTITSSGVTCGVEMVSSSTLEDDGIGSEIDDALDTLEGLSEEGNIEKAAAASS